MRKGSKTIFNYIVLAVAMLLSVNTATAKKVMVPKMYMYGFAASFNDTIVHFTNVQEVDSTWIDSKTRFLLGRENYSLQLQQHLATVEQMPYRTCIVVYGQNRKKVEKKFVKMRRRYMTTKKGKPTNFDIRYVDDKLFVFRPVDMSDPVAE